MAAWVIGLGTELYTAVVRRYQLYSCEIVVLCRWLYYLFSCRLTAMPTSQCTLHCPSVERNKLVCYCCLFMYVLGHLPSMFVCSVVLLQSALPDHVRAGAD